MTVLRFGWALWGGVGACTREIKPYCCTNNEGEMYTLATRHEGLFEREVKRQEWRHSDTGTVHSFVWCHVHVSPRAPVRLLSSGWQEERAHVIT